jgi:uncharacterized protein YndB with AHSA1/START domain
VKGSTVPITSVTTESDTPTLTVVAEFPVPRQRLWNAYADPRQLERFWGPPTYPATFTRHDMFPGGRSEYVMVGPEGDRSNGYWEVLEVNPSESFEVRDGFAHPDGTPNPDLPSMRVVFTFADTADGSRVTAVTSFNSITELTQLLDMGMAEGMRQAMGQMDEVLADGVTFAADDPVVAQILSDTQVRVSRVVRGTVDQVWRAHHDADLVRRWLLGPDGWTMPVCEVAADVGDGYRYEWEQADGSGRFGFTGVLLESAPPHRAVTTEQLIGLEGPGTVNEMTLTAVEGGTLLSILITYPSAEVRDMVLDTGMTAGMETSYARLERDVLGVG